MHVYMIQVNARRKKDGYERYGNYVPNAVGKTSRHRRKKSLEKRKHDKKELILSVACNEENKN